MPVIQRRSIMKDPDTCTGDASRTTPYPHHIHNPYSIPPVLVRYRYPGTTGCRLKGPRTVYLVPGTGYPSWLVTTRTCYRVAGHVHSVHYFRKTYLPLWRRHPTSSGTQVGGFGMPAAVDTSATFVRRSMYLQGFRKRQQMRNSVTRPVLTKIRTVYD